MTDWTAGYVAEIEYTHGYYRELSPGLIDFALLTSGHLPPRRAGMRYLELGYGQGLSANIHAAAAPGAYWGTDFSAAHAANARGLSGASGADGLFFDDSFEDFAGRSDLPDFDYIVLHGVWSWVSAENRQVLIDILRDRLKPGGVVFFSFNTLPGWAPALPLRQLMAIHSDTTGTPAQGPIGRIDAAIDFSKTLAEAGARYFTASPAAKARLDDHERPEPHLSGALEYFNRDWTPMYFAEANARLATDAKLSFVAPAAVLDQLLAYNLTPAQRDVLAGISYDILRETVRDYLLNQQFRRDLYARGARRMSPIERVQRLNDLPVALTVDPDEIPFEIDAGLRQGQTSRGYLRPGDRGARGRRRRPETHRRSRSQAKHIGPAGRRPRRGDHGSDRRRSRASGADPGRGGGDRLQPLMRPAERPPDRPRPHGRGDVTWLASPVTGGGVEVSRFQQMFLAARAKGSMKPAEWANDAWNVLSTQGQPLMKDGQPLKTDGESVAELTKQATDFAESRLPVLQRLRVAA